MTGWYPYVTDWATPKSKQQDEEKKQRNNYGVLYNQQQNLKAKNEVKEVAAFVFRQILIMLHPFIPFVTEKIWLTNKFDNKNKNFLTKNSFLK